MEAEHASATAVANDATTSEHPPSTSIFEATLRQVTETLDVYYAEATRRFKDYDEKYKLNERAKQVVAEARTRIEGARAELDTMLARVREIPATEVPAVAVSEIISRATSGVQSLTEQARALDIHGKLANVRARVGVALSDAMHVAAEFPQTVGTRVQERATAIDQQYNITGRTAEAVLSIDSRFGISETARALDERLRISQQAYAVSMRGQELDQHYLGGRATAAFTKGAELASHGVEYVNAQLQTLREEKEAGAEAEAAAAPAAGEEAEASAEGGAPSTSTGRVSQVATALASSLTTAAQTVGRQAAALDSRYGITATAARTAQTVDERLGLTGRARTLDDKYHVTERAKSAAERGAALDQRYLGGVVASAVERGSELARHGQEYVRARVAERSEGEGEGEGTAEGEAAAGGEGEAAAAEGAAMGSAEASS